MDVGSNVRYENNGKVIYGKIVGKTIPKCRCKGMSRWVVDFGNFRKEIIESDKKLVEDDSGNLRPPTNNLDFKF